MHAEITPLPVRVALSEAGPARGRAAFSLVEVMVAMTVLLIAMALTTGAYVSALKHAIHSENALTGAQQLRYASDVVSEAVRSAPQPPIVQSAGLQLLVAPKDLGYATVLETTWIDSLHNVKGSKANQRMLHMTNVTPSAVGLSVFSTSARPAGAVTAAQIATYFPDPGSLPTTDLNDLFAAGDTLTIPATPYGPQVTGVINSISNSPGSKTLTLVDNLGVDVPNGTRIAATAGRRLLFSVEANGDLRYYPDNRDLTKWHVLGRDIDPSPLSEPANLGSAVTTPFTVLGRTVALNLQRLPKGGRAGRTVQGVQTTVYTRTDPLIP